ncbi:MAG: exodeoxyribonuclease III [Bacteroidota bacterium]
MSTLNIISWNVNGIRAIMKKDFTESVQKLAPDILCIQETKAQKVDAEKVFALFPEYKAFINDSKRRKGYSGTAILSKEQPVSVTYDMGVEEHDQEGRIITAEYEKFFLVTAYVPNSGNELVRLDYREGWDDEFLKYLKGLEEKKPVVVCGDFNVANTEIDLARPKSNYNKTAGYTQREIDGFNDFLSAGFIDTFRSLHPEEIKYSYFSYRANARQNNVGWRIDYFLISESLKDQVVAADIFKEYGGSDHVPIQLQLKD